MFLAESLHSWVISVISTAAFCAVAINITPKGRVLSVVKLLCGLVMIFAIVSPFANINFNKYSESMAKYKGRAKELTQNADDYEDKLNRTFIEDKCAAYILDKAESYGIHISSVSVEAEWSVDGYWYPVSPDICSDCSDEVRSRLASWLESELGIAKERQTWTYG